MVLDKSSVWKAIQFFDEKETVLPSKVVSENSKEDTKTIHIEVTPGMNNIISKHHIETPNYQYNEII
ncbi:NEAT domain-containing protein [Staphylococcus saccharolyticus]|uniref:NEAT domain-containing protein n=1 Tax=Staphylococcus saccharolyticus TaxID=33028 RepID=UPI003B8A5DA1